jgi:hypothetical protein
LKRAITISERDTNSTAPAQHQIDVTVAVHVGRDEREGGCHRMGIGAGPKSAVAIAEENLDIAQGIRNQIGDSVAIGISHLDPFAVQPGVVPAGEKAGHFGAGRAGSY